MSKILNRPMFRGGGRVDSRGTGIVANLEYRVPKAMGGMTMPMTMGYNMGGQVIPKRGLVDGPGGYAGTVWGSSIVPPTPTGSQILSEANPLSWSQLGRGAKTVGTSGMGILRSLGSFGTPGGSSILPSLLLGAAASGPITMASLLNPETEEEKEAMKALEEGVGISGEAVDPDLYKALSEKVGIARSKADRAFSMDKEEAKKLEEELKKEEGVKTDTVTGTSTDTGTRTDTGIETIIEPEQSNADVINEYMNMFKSVLGSDQDELTRQRYLELAKFGTNLLAQGGGKRGLMEKIGAAGTQSLEGLSKIAAQERASDKQIKLAAIQAAMKEMDPGTVGKAVRDLKKLVPKEKGESSKDYNARITSMALETGTGSATRYATAYKAKENLANSLVTDEIVSTKTAGDAAAQTISSFKIPLRDVRKDVAGTPKEDKKYYVRKDGTIYRFNAKSPKNSILPGEPGF